MQNLQPFIDSLQSFAQKRLNFKDPPKLFLKQDEENAKDIFGKTAYYDSNEKSITIYTTGRHPKDILRSIAHELVHHCQNLRGDLSPEKCGDMGADYAQKNDHMREMEREAYEKGNLCFRDWEDGIKVAMQQENNQLKENNKMVKITQKDLKSLVKKIVESRLSENKNQEEIKKLKKTLENIPNMKQMTQYKEKLKDDPNFFRDMERYVRGKIRQLEKKASGTDDKKASAVVKNAPAVKGGKEIADFMKSQDDDPEKGFSKPRNIKKEGNSITALGSLHSDVEELDEAGCSSHKRDEDSVEEGMKIGRCCGRNNCEHPRDDHLIKEEELEEGEKPDYVDLDKDGNRKESMKKAAADAKAEKNESKIQTPEQEKRLYESRFNKRNEEIFDKLKKLWTK